MLFVIEKLSLLSLFDIKKEELIFELEEFDIPCGGEENLKILFFDDNPLLFDILNFKLLIIFE